MAALDESVLSWVSMKRREAFEGDSSQLRESDAEMPMNGTGHRRFPFPTNIVHPKTTRPPSH